MRKNTVCTSICFNKVSLELLIQKHTGVSHYQTANHTFLVWLAAKKVIFQSFAFSNYTVLSNERHAGPTNRPLS